MLLKIKTADIVRANYDLGELILDFIKHNPLRSSKEIHDGLGVFQHI